METYIENLLQALENKKKKKQIDYIVSLSDYNGFDKITNIEHQQLPQSVTSFYNVIEQLNINSPRFFEILPIAEMKMLNDKLLWFSSINRTEKICFNTEKLNNAGEWDIVEFKTNYVITKTLSSYICNKLWAWVERSRKIWAEEIFE